jgi:hypothetical protein
MRLVALLFAAALIPGWAQAAVIGGPLVRDGIEVVPSVLTDAELDRLPTSMSHAPDTIFLVADVHAGKDEVHGFAEHAFIPYLSISYVLTKDDMPTFKKVGLLVPIASKSGPHYAAAAEMAGPGSYRLTYIVSPPSAHGMLRQTDKTGGVPDWWKPVTASWNFTYPMSAK